MRRTLLLGLLVFLVGTLVACNGDDSSDSNGEGGGQIGLFDWDRDANAVVVRLDSVPTYESSAFLLNSVPPCTLWGDGRLVWSVSDSSGGEQILEARLADDAAIRSFLESIIARGFYDWEDELLPPANDPVVETVTVSLYSETRTVRRYSVWPQNSFARILEDCRNLSATPVLVMPDAGWISAYEVPEDPAAPIWLWPSDAPFTLSELARNGEARWLEGPLATRVWQSIREDPGNTQIIERNGDTFQVAIVVPGFSRDSVPAPEDANP